MTRPVHPLPFVLAASDHGPMIVNRLDVHQLPTGVAYGVGHQILSRGAYDPEEIADVKSLLDQRRAEAGDGLVVVDCGANIGVHTVEMARHMTGWGRVVAIEAQERLYYALCGNIALNNLFNASAIHAAVGEFDGMLGVPQPNYLKPASFGSIELKHKPDTEYVGQSISYAAKDLIKISQTRLDSLNLPRLDFLKIDVEGMEVEVLRGAREAIAQFRPTMLIEWIKSDQVVLEKILREFGYEIKVCGANLLAKVGEM